MMMLLFGFIGLMIDLVISMIWMIIKILVYVSPFALLVYFLRRERRI